MGDSFTDGVSATAWIWVSKVLFPYKDWVKSSPCDSGDESRSSERDDDDTLSEKAVCTACQLSSAVELTLEGKSVKTNKLAPRPRWTKYEKKRLHQSLLSAACWTIQASSGSVFAKRCQGVTTNSNRTCLSCIEVSHLEGLKCGVRQARAWSVTAGPVHAQDEEETHAYPNNP
jgi:hypothetical protein